MVWTLAVRRKITVYPTGGTRLQGADRTVEADGSYCFGDRAILLHNARREGNEDAFVERNPPQPVVEVERAHGDAGEPAIYRTLGAEEMWRISTQTSQAHGGTGQSRQVAEILDLQHHEGWRPVTDSRVFPGMTAFHLTRLLRQVVAEGIWMLPELILRIEAEPDRDPMP